LIEFRGAYTAMVTPLDAKSGLDEDGLRKNVEFQIKHGIHVLVPVGTTGECATLDYEEHKRAIEVTVETAKGRVPVMAGTGSNSTHEAIMLTRYAKEVGADAALSVVPYYNKPTQRGLYEHFKKVAETVDLPQFIYNIPSRTGVNMEPETVAKLSKVKNIAGIKEASNIEQVMHIIHMTSRDFAVFAGDDDMTFPTLALGGVGVISVASNIVPGKIAEIVNTFFDGNIEKSRELYHELLPLFKVLFIETNPAPVKAAMEMMGMAAGPLRLPLVEILPENREKLRKVLVELKLVRR
jgi:4-hydroxy-tetrahydrodipicolinate synthase